MAPLWGQYWNTKKSWELKSAEKHSRDKHHVTERVNLAVVLYGNNCFLGELQTPPPPRAAVFILPPRLSGWLQGQMAFHSIKNVNYSSN